MAERTDVHTLFDGGRFFEGPRWRDGTWWVSDFYRHTVSRIAPDGTETVVVEVEAQPSGLGWLPDGSLVISPR
jgi:sugar lactone lactonase YvrE